MEEIVINFPGVIHLRDGESFPIPAMQTASRLLSIYAEAVPDDIREKLDHNIEHKP